jgi:N-acetylmuramic acid 6-phosphate etherase
MRGRRLHVAGRGFSFLTWRTGWKPGRQTMQDRSHLLTEKRLEASMHLDSMTIEQAVEVMNQQDQIAAEAVAAVRPAVAKAVALVAEAFGKGGRLFYVGAGTSGRLGVLDASECPPTFRSDPAMVQGIIAGGEQAMFRSQEGAEDSAETGAAVMDQKGVGAADVVCGIAAGGTTPYVHGALRRARTLGAKTVFLTCVDGIIHEPQVDVVIRPLTGPEVVTGSTRLKAGTATKLVLNQLTTLAMVQLGKVHGNLMVDLRATNQKLWDRGARIIATITQIPKDQAMELLQRAEGHVKAALVMQRRNVDLAEARRLLDEVQGQLHRILK